MIRRPGTLVSSSAATGEGATGDTTPGGVADAFLLEDGTSALLLEDGSSDLLME